MSRFLLLLSLVVASMASTTSATAQNHGRPRRAQGSGPPPRYFKDPSYALETGVRPGGFKGPISMEVTLGPYAGLSTSRGTTPGADQCKAVNRLSLMPGMPPWIKGHLLNQELGGPGVSENLTPLTKKANSAYLHAVESRLKNAVDWCRRRADYHKADADWFGVYFRVEVQGKNWPDDPDPAKRAVGRSLRWTAHYVRMNKATGRIDPSDGHRPDEAGRPEVFGGSIRCVQ